MSLGCAPSLQPSAAEGTGGLHLALALGHLFHLCRDGADSQQQHLLINDPAMFNFSLGQAGAALQDV